MTTARRQSVDHSGLQFMLILIWVIWQMCFREADNLLVLTMVCEDQNLTGQKVISFCFIEPKEEIFNLQSYKNGGENSKSLHLRSLAFFSLLIFSMTNLLSKSLLINIQSIDWLFWHYIIYVLYLIVNVFVFPIFPFFTEVLATVTYIFSSILLYLWVFFTFGWTK